MNKRSALAIAAGLVLTLIVGGLAVAAGLTGPTVSSAVPDADRRSAPEPVVRTVRRTVTVHEKADEVGEVVQVAAPASSASASSGSEDDDAYEDDEYEDDEYEDDEYEDEGHDDRDDEDDHDDDHEQDEDHGDDD